MSVIEMNEPPKGWVYCNKPLEYLRYKKVSKYHGELVEFIANTIRGLKEDIVDGVIVWRSYPSIKQNGDVFTVNFRLAAMKYE